MAKGKLLGRVRGSVSGGGSVLGGVGSVDPGRMARVRVLKDLEKEMESLGAEKKQLRGALLSLEGLGAGVLEEEKRGLRESLKKKEREFAGVVSRHVAEKKRKFGGGPAASSTMTTPAGGGGGVGGSGVFASSTSTPGRGGNRGSRRGGRGSGSAGHNVTFPSPIPRPSPSPDLSLPLAPAPLPVPLAPPALPSPVSPVASFPAVPPQQFASLLGQFAAFLAQGGGSLPGVGPAAPK